MDFSKFAYSEEASFSAQQASTSTSFLVKASTKEEIVIDDDDDFVEIVASNEKLDIAKNTFSLGVSKASTSFESLSSTSKQAMRVINATEALGLPERYKSPYQQYENPLKVLIVGHNPSYQSFTKGHYYANPANRMWHLLTQRAKILPSYYIAKDDIHCPYEHRIGFTDVCCGVCETISGNISDDQVRERRTDFYQRLLSHCQRVQRDHNLATIEEAAPQVIAFAGVRQFKALFPIGYGKASSGGSRKRNSSSAGLGKTSKLMKSFLSQYGDSSTTAMKLASSAIDLTDDGENKVVDYDFSNENDASISAEVGKESNKKTSNSTIPYGVQKELPPDWPCELASSIVFLLPSTSGAAAMTNEQREAPYIELGELVQTLPSLPQWEKCKEKIAEL